MGRGRKDGRIGRGVWGGVGTEGNAEEHDTKGKAWERRPGAWETTFSRESSKLESRTPACGAREMPTSTIFGCHPKLPGGIESVGRNPGGGGS